MGKVIDATYRFLMNQRPRALGTYTEQAPYGSADENDPTKGPRESEGGTKTTADFKKRSVINRLKKSILKKLQPIKDQKMSEMGKSNQGPTEKPE